MAAPITSSLQAAGTVQPGDTYDSIAQALALGIGGGAALAGANGQTDAAEHPNGATIATPTLVGTSESWTFTAAPVATIVFGPGGIGHAVSVATQTFDFAFGTGGVLNLDTRTYVPMTFEGADAPAPELYVVDAADRLLGIYSISTVPGGGAPATFSVTTTLTSNPAETDSAGRPVAASSTLQDTVGPDFAALSLGGGGTFTATGGLFQLPTGGAQLPFIAEGGGTTTTAGAPARVSPVGVVLTQDLAVFNSSSDTPDGAWTIGVNQAGDAVITGSAAAGYLGTATLTRGELVSGVPTPDVTSVQFDRTTYALSVIPDAGVTSLDGAITGLVAEGTGTSVVMPQDVQWHINGTGDRITLGLDADDKFYFAGPRSAYTLAWDPAADVLTVSGGSTGSTVFNLGGTPLGTSEISFGDGNRIGLGSNELNGVEDATIYAGSPSYSDIFVLTGGTQSIFATPGGQVLFKSGSDDADAWAIRQATGPGGLVEAVFDGTGAGYAGVATLSDVTQVELVDKEYVLTSIAVGAGPVTIASGDDGGNIVTDAGGARISFDQPYWQNDWFVGGSGDVATLAKGNTEIILAGPQSAYALTRDSGGDVLIAGGSTGTTEIVLAGGTGEVRFGDASTVALAFVGSGSTPPSAPVGGDVTITAISGGFAYAAGDLSDTVVTTGGSANLVTLGAGQAVVDAQGTDTVTAGAGTDLVFASGPAATVNGGAGALIFVAGAGSYAAGGGSGADVLYGGAGSDTLTGGAGANSIIVAGVGNTTLTGGSGSVALMFGGLGSSTFAGSAGGSDTMVGGAGADVFAMTGGDIAFGGANGPDSFDAGAGAALIVEGPGSTQVALGSGALTAFAGSGVDTYTVAKGLGGTAGIVGFKACDRIVLTGGFTAADASAAVSEATVGGFGTSLALPDGTRITLFGASLSASQLGVG